MEMEIKRSALVLSIVVIVALFGSGVVQVFAQSSIDQTTPLHGTIPVSDEIEWPAYADLAEITITDAIKTARKRRSGTPIMAQLIELDGFLIWYVYIVNSKHDIDKVAIDAGNGTILRVDRYNEKREE